MKYAKSIFLGILIVITSFLLSSCASTSNSQKSTAPSKADKQWELANNYRKQGKYVLAVAEMEKLAEIYPNYRISASFNYSPSQAAPWGIKTDSSIGFSDFSIYLFIAFVYFDMAGTGSDPEKYVPQADRQATFEKALSAYRKGYEIDITNKGNNNRNLQKIYLAGIGVTLDRLGRTAEANSSFTELSKISSVTDPIARRIGLPVETPRVASSYEGDYRISSFIVGGGLNMTDEVGLCRIAESGATVIFLVLVKGSTNPRTGTRNMIVLSNYNSSSQTYQKISWDGTDMDEMTGSIKKTGNRVILEALFSSGNEAFKLDLTKI